MLFFKEGLIHVDPGPGAFVYLKGLGIDAIDIDLVVLSHIHLDHSADINSIIEAATDGGRIIKTALFAPKSAFEGDNRVVLPFIRKRLAKEGYLSEGVSLSFNGLSVQAVMSHSHHGTETYALFFQNRVLYVSCGMFEERMLELYPKNPEVMLINTTLLVKKPYIQHLCVDDAKILISSLKPKRAFLTHFGDELLSLTNPDEIASSLSDELGIEVLAARDSMEVLL
ncbi:MAG: MBL fold metallo-hydrolase [Aquificaceae bacterium]